ncbi:MFS transporter [Nocardioides ferulae]|uniref:MFS transporter n=1 Tax=Nocardioides ferulae TaxID=2340821 RepID=UPI000EACC9AC|nr:MFS transporter [Nocardioides ferulae]
MPALTTTRNAVAVVFALNGFMFATLVSRLPDVRSDLALDNGALGLLLLSASAASLIALPSSGWLIQRLGAANVVRLAASLAAVGLILAAVGATVVDAVLPTAVGLFVYGLGFSGWDVAMNVEAAEVERRFARTMMPRFHAAWSLGSFAGAGLGIPLTAWDVPMVAHVLVLVVGGWLATMTMVRTFLPPTPEEHTPTRVLAAWAEPRTLAIGVMVLAFAVVEGTANDWLTLALIDGYEAPHWAGVAGFALFVAAMTAGRLFGPVALDAFGRAPVLWASSAASAAGVVMVVFGGHWLPVAVGILVWGVGASLGFPVGMSAAADDPIGAAARVSVVSTIGYGAFLAGPPLLGMLGDRVGTLEMLLVVAALMVPAALTVFAARPAPGRTQGGVAS